MVKLNEQFMHLLKLKMHYLCRHIFLLLKALGTPRSLQRLLYQIVKNLLKKTQDPYKALLPYRSTPLEIGYSPSELLMCRRLRTTVPDIPEQWKPKVPDTSFLVKKDNAKSHRKSNFDIHKGVQNRSPLCPGDSVWITDGRRGCTVEPQCFDHRGTRGCSVYWS